MELHRIRGGTKEDLEAGIYNIGVGISLGNKWFTMENIVGLVKWSLSYTREKVIVYVADSIHAINLEVRNDISHSRALELANKKGVELLQEIEVRLRKDLSAEEFNKVSFARWEDLLTESFIAKKEYLVSQYSSSEPFKEYIHNIVISVVANESKKFSQEEINKLGTYIIEELPEIICRVPINGIAYEANAYPFDSGVTKLAEEIQKNNLFPEIREAIFDTEPKVFLEVR